MQGSIIPIWYCLFLHHKVLYQENSESVSQYFYRDARPPAAPYSSKKIPKDNKKLKWKALGSVLFGRLKQRNLHENSSAIFLSKAHSHRQERATLWLQEQALKYLFPNVLSHSPCNTRTLWGITTAWGFFNGLKLRRISGGKGVKGQFLCKPYKM